MEHPKLWPGILALYCGLAMVSGSTWAEINVFDPAGIFPKVGLPDPRKELDNTINLIDAIASGNRDNLETAVGKSIVEGVHCIGCREAIKKALPDLTNEQVNSIVGQGYLLYLSTENVILVTAITARNITEARRLNSQDPDQTRSASPIATEGQPEQYSVKAKCIVTKKGETVAYAGWQNAPIFKDKDGKQYTYPDAPIVEGDIISISAPICKSMTNKSTGQKSVKSAKIIYEGATIFAGQKDVLKWWIRGSKI